MDMTLMDVRPGYSCIIKNIFVNNLRKRIIDMGLTTGTRVIVKKLAPLGDPMEIQVRGYLLTLRKAEARMIDVELLDEVIK
jgi:ferrous iron transport protein A